MIPAGNIQSRVIELEHEGDWAQKNNLKLNRAKAVEIVIIDSRRKSHYDTVPPILPDICRVTSIKVFGVTFTNIFRLDALAKALSVIATATWLAGWLGGWLSHSGIVSKPLNLSENFFDHLKAPSF